MVGAGLFDRIMARLADSGIPAEALTRAALGPVDEFHIGGGTATVRVSKAFQAGRFRISPQLQINWLSADIANYDFGVPAEAATLARPAYSTGSAVSYEAGIGSFIELTEEWRIILSISAEALPSEISDSPIVNDDTVIKGFAAITYVF